MKRLLTAALACLSMLGAQPTIAREFDVETGLVHMRARDYDPDTGRFLQEDPIQPPMTLDPRSLDLYVYAYNNPLRYTDPYGLSPEEQQFAEFAACVEADRLDPYAGLAALGSALPLKGLFGAPGALGSEPLTTLPSIAAFYMRPYTPALAGGLRTGGRYASNIFTPLTVFEGFYDIGKIGRCAVIHRRPKNQCSSH